MSLEPIGLLAFFCTLAIFVVIGIYTIRLVKSSQDFSIGQRKASWAVVSGTIMGTLVGGASTIGTAQLAFQYGFSAWWFTLGAGIACFVLGVLFLPKLYRSGSATIPQLLCSRYNQNIGAVSAIFSSLGIFMNIIAQGLSAFALITSIIPMSPILAAGACFFLVLMYLYWGGIWSTGFLGIAKILFLFAVTILCGVFAFQMLGGVPGIRSTFDSFPWLSLFGRGMNTDLAAGFSLIVGVLSTQTYFQAVVAASNLKQAKKGVFLSSFLIPLVGIGGILVGLYMRAHFPSTPSEHVLTVFISQFFPPIVVGIIFATLLITIVGTWAGLTLGITTMLTKDVYHKHINPQAGDRKILGIQRILILALTAISLFFVVGNMQSLILSWSFLSMGLRGCTILPALIGALFFQRWVTPLAGVVSVIVGPVTAILWYYFSPIAIDALYPGLILGVLTLILISFFGRHHQPQSEHPSNRISNLHE